jgi:hypothetical protein
MMHNEKKLPKWAQRELEALRQQRETLAGELDRVKRAHAVLASRSDWFTIQGPPKVL